MPSKKNYHSSKLKFLMLKWSITKHFKEYLAYVLFVVRTDNNPLTYILTTPNLDATGCRWVGTLASFEFTLEYQKGADNGAADALSQVPICHNRKMVKSLLEGALIGALGRGEAEASEELLCEHVHLENKVHVKAAKLAPMHLVDWGEAQEADAALAACHQCLKTCKDTPLPKRDALLKQYLGCHMETEEGCALFCVWNSLVLNKGLMYVSTMPKGEAEGILAFVVPGKQCQVALNGIHHNAGHQGQQCMLALAQECFWWSMMVKDCCTLVRGCQQCRAFEGVISKAPLCPIQAHVPLELIHMDLTSVESTMELNKRPCVKSVLVITDHLTRYTLAMVTKDETAKTIVRILYKRFIAVFGVPAKILSNCGANFTSTLVEEQCTAFGIQKCRMMAYHAQCNGHFST